MPEGGSTVELVGVAPAMRDIDRWADQLGPAVDREALAFGGQVAGRVTDRVPVLTGMLASSVDAVDLGGDEYGIGVTMGEGVPYAGWIEFGGSRGRPFIPEGRYLYPTAMAAEDDWRREASDIADATARSYPWSTPSTV
jgi:hypothetical protein